MGILTYRRLSGSRSAYANKTPQDRATTDISLIGNTYPSVPWRLGININPSVDGEIFKRMINNLVAFIYDIARLDKIKTEKEKQQFIEELIKNLEEKILPEE